MIRVYVAGPYSGDTITTLGNIRRGISLSVRLLLKGYAVYCPWLDWLYGLFADVPIEVYQANGIEWLKTCHAMILVEGWEKSKGTAREMEIANEFEIPIFLRETELDAWNLDRFAMEYREED